MGGLVPQRKILAGEVDPQYLLQFMFSIDPTQLRPDFGLVKKGDIEGGHIKLDTVVEGTYSRVLTTDISSGHILLSETTGDLDNISDGTNYSRVLTTDITSGHILLSETTGDLDDIANGTYGKVLTADISSGHVELSATVESASANYVTNNEKTGADDAYDFFVSKLTAYGLSIRSSVSASRIQITATHIAGYAADVLQFEISASDGKGYFGAGKCVLSSSGIRLCNDDTGVAFLHFGSSTYEASIYKETGSTGSLVLSPGANRYVLTDRLKFVTVAGGGELRLPVKTDTGDPTGTDARIYVNDYDNKIRCYADGAWRDLATW